MKLVIQIAVGIVVGFFLLLLTFAALAYFATTTPEDGYKAGHDIGYQIGYSLRYIIPVALLVGLIYTGYRAFIKKN